MQVALKGSCPVKDWGNSQSIGSNVSDAIANSSSVSSIIEASGLSHVASCHKVYYFRKSKFHSVWL